MKVYANKEKTRAIMADDYGNIYKSFGLRNVLCCDASSIVKTEELTECFYDTSDDYWSFAWTEEYFGEDENAEEDYYTPSAYAGDYSPSCPWNAPGMSISDFI